MLLWLVSYVWCLRCLVKGAILPEMHEPSARHRKSAENLHLSTSRKGCRLKLPSPRVIRLFSLTNLGSWSHICKIRASTP